MQSNIIKTHQSDPVKSDLSWKHSHCVSLSIDEVLRLDITEPCSEREIKPFYEPTYGFISTASPTFWKQKKPSIAAELCLTESPSPLAEAPGQFCSPEICRGWATFCSLPVFPGERKRNPALEDYQRDSSKAKSRRCHSALGSTHLLSHARRVSQPVSAVLTVGVPLSSGRPQAAPCKDPPLQKAALRLCGFLLSALRLTLSSRLITLDF